jgi:hypothetical protein
MKNEQLKTLTFCDNCKKALVVIHFRQYCELEIALVLTFYIRMNSISISIHVGAMQITSLGC